MVKVSDAPKHSFFMVNKGLLLKLFPTYNKPAADYYKTTTHMEISINESIIIG